MQYSLLTQNSLREAPNTTTLIYQGREYLVEHLSFCAPENQGKTPVVFLGGAFQSFVSFKSEVELVYGTHPVVLLDLPSQGANQQLAPELKLEDYAELIELFCQTYSLDKLMMLGISYGSAMAMLFSTAYPARLERLLLSGITCFRRASLITLLEDSLEQLALGNMQAFATTAVCNLFNHSRFNETEANSTALRRLLFRQISRLNDNERARYDQNTRRLLNFPGFKQFPACPTLIATGEYDNFTLPSENAAVAMQCKNATFALIKKADHLSQMERQVEASTLFHGFMCAKPLHNIAGIDVLDPTTFSADQRMQDRLRPLEQPYILRNMISNTEHTVRIRNINFEGLELELIDAEFNINGSAKDLHLEIPETGHSYHIRVLERHGKSVRALIIQRDLKAADALVDYLENYFLLVRKTPNKPLTQAL